MGVSRVSTAGFVALGILIGPGLTAPLAAADPAPADPAAQAVTDTAAAGPVSSPSDGVPHLPSPDHLPPGTTQAAPERRRGFLRDLVEAVREQDVSLGDAAMLLLTHRPSDAGMAQSDSTPRPPATADPNPVGAAPVVEAQVSPRAPSST